MKIYLPGRVMERTGGRRALVLALLCLLLTPGFAPAEGDAPGSVQALWAEMDPAAEPLDVRIVRQWEEDGLVLRYVTFHIGTFKTRAARPCDIIDLGRGERKKRRAAHSRIARTALFVFWCRGEDLNLHPLKVD